MRKSISDLFFICLWAWWVFSVSSIHVQGGVLHDKECEAPPTFRNFEKISLMFARQAVDHSEKNLEQALADQILDVSVNSYLHEQEDGLHKLIYTLNKEFGRWLDEEDTLIDLTEKLDEAISAMEKTYGPHHSSVRNYVDLYREAQAILDRVSEQRSRKAVESKRANDVLPFVAEIKNLLKPKTKVTKTHEEETRILLAKELYGKKNNPLVFAKDIDVKSAIHIDQETVTGKEPVTASSVSDDSIYLKIGNRNLIDEMNIERPSMWAEGLITLGIEENLFKSRYDLPDEAFTEPDLPHRYGNCGYPTCPGDEPGYDPVKNTVKDLEA